MKHFGKKKVFRTQLKCFHSRRNHFLQTKQAFVCQGKRITHVVTSPKKYWQTSPPINWGSQAGQCVLYLIIFNGLEAKNMMLSAYRSNFSFSTDGFPPTWFQKKSDILRNIHIEIPVPLLLPITSS